jgi:hypothetical protein
VGFPTSNGGSTQPPTHGRASFELIGPGLQGITYGPLPLHLLLRTGSAWSSQNSICRTEVHDASRRHQHSQGYIRFWYDMMPMLDPMGRLGWFKDLAMDFG